jgi:hypothetical protein
MIDETLIEKVGNAIEDADLGYSLKLTRLVDGEETYTLKIDGLAESFEFDDIHDGYAKIREMKFQLKAEAAIKVVKEYYKIGQY